MTKSKPSLRDALNRGDFIVAPGMPDLIAATIANKVGFDFVFYSGYWSSAAIYGLPDVGLTTYTQMVERVRLLAQTSSASVIADADTGFGGLLNVHHTVQGYEQAGAIAIQLEDQEFPKKCGHVPYKQVIETSEMADKVRVACEARANPTETLIIARTDARQPEGFESALARGVAYDEAGADIVFIEALESEQEMREACAAIKKPMLVNMADGGKTPIRPASELADIGYQIAIFPALTSLAASFAIEKALNHLKTEGTSISPEIPLFSFDEFSEMIGFPEVFRLEKKWGRIKDD
ncbi:MAG: isocitrate lyase/PEP mutase family protein [Pseudomonadota bacterium]